MWITYHAFKSHAIIYIYIYIYFHIIRYHIVCVFYHSRHELLGISSLQKFRIELYFVFFQQEKKMMDMSDIEFRSKVRFCIL